MSEGMSLPATVSHYTSVSALRSIVSSGAIWASHPRYLNDRDEARKGLDIASKKLRARGETVPFDNTLRLAAQDWGKWLRNDTMYVASFSAPADSLAMWQTYASVDGFSIQFNTAVFEEHISASLDLSPGKAEFRRVAYGFDEFEAAVDVLLEQYQQDGSRGSSALCRDLFTLAATVKDKGWAHEEEWRLLCPIRYTAPPKKYRERAGGIVPYIDVGFQSPDDNPGFRSEIESVTIGPCHDPDHKVEALEMFLRANGYVRARVDKSVTPLRPL